MHTPKCANAHSNMAKTVIAEGNSEILKNGFKLFEELFFKILISGDNERQELELSDFSVLMEPKTDDLQIGLLSREYNKHGHFWIRYCDVPDEKADSIVRICEQQYHDGVLPCEEFHCYVEDSDQDEC